MTTKTKKATKKPAKAKDSKGRVSKSDQLQEANKRVETLTAECEKAVGQNLALKVDLGATEGFISTLRDELAREKGRVRQLEAHVLDMREYIDDLWNQVDVLKRMLAGSMTVADGLTACEAARNVLKNESMEIVQKTRKSAGGPISTVFHWKERGDEGNPGDES